MTMRVIKPTAITDAMLQACSVLENEHTEWSNVTAYSIGQRVRYTAGGVHKVYACLVAHTGANPTTDASDPPKWKEVGPTNRWAMFDRVNSTVTQDVTQISVTIAPGLVRGLFLGGLVGRTVQVTVTDGPAGPQIYDSGEISLDGTSVRSWSEYFFAGFEQKTKVWLTDLPLYSSAVITVTVSAGVGAAVAIGTLVVGRVTELAGVRFNPTAGIIDYSTKETDPDTGTTTFEQDAYSDRTSLSMFVDNADIDRVYRFMVSMRATPAVWIPSEETRFAFLTLFGFYRDFSVTVPYPTYSLCDLQLEGLT